MLGEKRNTAKQALRKSVESHALKYFVFCVALLTNLDILGIFEK